MGDLKGLDLDEIKVLTNLLDQPKISQKEIVALLDVGKTRAKTILSELMQ